MTKGFFFFFEEEISDKAKVLMKGISYLGTHVLMFLLVDNTQ